MGPARRLAPRPRVNLRRERLVRFIGEALEQGACHGKSSGIWLDFAILFDGEAGEGDRVDHPRGDRADHILPTAAPRVFFEAVLKWSLVGRQIAEPAAGGKVVLKDDAEGECRRFGRVERGEVENIARLRSEREAMAGGEPFPKGDAERGDIADEGDGALAGYWPVACEPGEANPRPKPAPGEDVEFELGVEALEGRERRAQANRGAESKEAVDKGSGVEAHSEACITRVCFSKTSVYVAIGVGIAVEGIVGAANGKAGRRNER